MEGWRNSERERGEGEANARLATQYHNTSNSLHTIGRYVYCIKGRCDGCGLVVAAVYCKMACC